METMLAVLASAAKGGWKTTEFWVTVAAVVLPYAAQNTAQVPGTAGVIAQVAIAAAGAAASGLYANSRSKVKVATIAAATVPAASEAAYQITGAGAGVANSDTAK